jgi:tetratricopeptide (TPR) repeat protein
VVQLISNGFCRVVFGVCLGLALAWLAPERAFAQVEEAVQAFDEGNTAYREGDYEKAIASYEEAIGRGFVSGALYYNLGNAYYRHDRIGQAIRYYEKARLLMPDNRELLHNLEIARAQTVDQFSQLPLPSWTRWWRSMIASSAGRGLFVFGILTYLLAIGLVIYRLWTGVRNPWIRRARAAALGAAVLLLGAAFAASIQSERQGQAVVIVNQVALRQQPAENAVTELAIHEGVLVDILQQNDLWIEVRLPNGARGWVTADAVAEV